MSRCPAIAEVAIPWAGRIMNGCMGHANAMAALNQAIGGVMEMRMLPPDSAMCEFQDDLPKTNMKKSAMVDSEEKDEYS